MASSTRNHYVTWLQGVGQISAFEEGETNVSLKNRTEPIFPPPTKITPNQVGYFHLVLLLFNKNFNFFFFTIWLSSFQKLC